MNKPREYNQVRKDILLSFALDVLDSKINTSLPKLADQYGNILEALEYENGAIQDARSSQNINRY